jgi:hypothetical protein
MVSFRLIPYHSLSAAIALAQVQQLSRLATEGWPGVFHQKKKIFLSLSWMEARQGCIAALNSRLAAGCIKIEPGPSAITQCTRCSCQAEDYISGFTCQSQARWSARTTLEIFGQKQTRTRMSCPGLCCWLGWPSARSCQATLWTGSDAAEPLLPMNF